MESLLSLAFDNLSARNASKTSKGLRQIEGLLAQICLSSSDATTSPKQPISSSTENSQQTDGPRQLDILTDDLAFQEFFRLQSNFEWNVATRLVECLERLLGLHSTAQTDDMIFSALTILQGALLLHPPSGALFSRENHMTLLLDLLDPDRTSAQTLSAALGVILTALLDRPVNIRLFEALDGIRTLASVCKSKSDAASSPDVKARCIDCIRFYVMPEVPAAIPSAPAAVPTVDTSTEPNTPSNTSVDMPPPALPASATPNFRPSSAPRLSTTPSLQRVPSSRSNQGSTGTSSTKSDGSNASWSTNPTSVSSSGSGRLPPGTRSTAEKWRILRSHFASSDDLLHGFGGLSLAA